MSVLRTPDGRKRFEWVDGALYQRSMLDPKLEWKMSLVKNSVDPASPGLQRQGGARETDVEGPNEPALGRGRRAATIWRTRTTTWSAIPATRRGRTVAAAAICRSKRTGRPSGTTTRAARRATSRPTTRRSRATRCSCSAGAVRRKAARSRRFARRPRWCLSSTNANREQIYIQQPPIAASGFSSQAFNPHYPHTERKTETKTCSDCHLSAAGDNNAIMAQLLMLGTNFVNFVGFNAWVGEAGEISAVQVTEWDEPQAVIGSYLHRYAYPDWYAAHKANGRMLENRARATPRATRTVCSCAVNTSMWRKGASGARVYDVASIANKGVSRDDHHGAVQSARAGHAHRVARTRPASRCRRINRSIRCATKAS